MEFHNAGRENPERCLIAANRVGKTACAAAEIAIHCTGEYPEWWGGRKFSKAIAVWTGAVTNEASRDIIQAALLGDPHGTGWIPKDKLGKVSYRQAGVSEVVDTIKVRHKSGGRSAITLKTYDQGRQKWQGTSQHVVWLDEEPKQDIYTEAITRCLDVKGVVMLTFTPLLGASDVVRHFTTGGPGIYVKNVTWDDAPHLDKDERERLSMSYPDWERDTRTKGVPMLGSGAVYPVGEESIKIHPIDIPSHWPRIAGLDIGWDHPTAVAWIAWDRDADVIYVYDHFRETNALLSTVASAIKKRGHWIPVAWPHDAIKADPRSGKPFFRLYKDEGVRMIKDSARYDKDIGGGQPREPVVAEILERMKTGRFKVFSTCQPLFEEMRMYHRDDGKIVAKHDDLISAVHYAVMMKRKAQTNVAFIPVPKYTRPIVGARL